MPEISPSKYMVQASWDDVPHLDEKTKREMMASYPPYMRDARTKGIPSMGAGAIYPIAWEDVSCDPFPIPDFWPRGYGMDVGWKHPTAAIWLAKNPADLTIYAYSEYRQSERKPLEHAQAIKARGTWMKGAIDPSSQNSTIADGQKLIRQYRTLGLKLVTANNEVHSALDHIWTMLATGRLVFFNTLRMTENEYRNYRRVEKKDENGATRSKIVKAHDDLMDALRYGVMTFDAISGVRPAEQRQGASSPAVADSQAGY